MKRSLYLLLVVCLVLVQFNQGSAEESIFENPVLLTVGTEPLNNDGKIMYPSPAIFDVDNDGKNELVLGSIFGGLFACEDQSTEKGKHNWSAPVDIKSTDGEPLQLNNW